MNSAGPLSSGECVRRVLERKGSAAPAIEELLQQTHAMIPFRGWMDLSAPLPNRADVITRIAEERGHPGIGARLRRDLRRLTYALSEA
jgi:hypothetical protein